MPNLHGLCVDFGWGLVVEAVLALAVLVAVYLTSRSMPLEYALSAGVIGGLLVSHHAYLHDCCLLVFALGALRNAVQGFRLGLLAMIVLPPIYLFTILDSTRVQGNILLVVLFTATLVSLLFVRRPLIDTQACGASSESAMVPVSS